MSNSIQSILESIETWSLEDLTTLNHEIVKLHKSKKRSLGNALKQDLVIGNSYKVNHKDYTIMGGHMHFKLEKVNRTRAILNNFDSLGTDRISVPFSLLSPCDSPRQKAYNYWDEQKGKINQIGNEVWEDMDDQGSCVLGMKLHYNGIEIANQICQGSLTNEEYFKRVIEHYVSEGKDEEQFHIEYGRMD